MTLGLRITQIASWIVLAAAGAYTFSAIFAFSQQRFFSVDEYQYGHATWLVAGGAIPYLDFFEHHFPGSYVLHAPFYWVDWDFVTGALLLRKIVFGYWLLLSAFAALACFRVTQDRFAAALVAIVPVSFGFSLVSAIDYRADNFGAVYFAACLLLLEWNRHATRRSLVHVPCKIDQVIRRHISFPIGKAASQ